MSCKLPGAVLCLALLGAALSCGEKDAMGVRRVAPEAARGDATITGKVHFRGTPPPKKVLKTAPCHEGSNKEVIDETVVVDENGGLANVFVYIENGPMVDGRNLPPAVMDQVDCVYTPHAVGVVVNQVLAVKSSDPVFHNTAYTPQRNPADNFALLRAGAEKHVRFVAAEVFPIRCDVHPWMSAYVGVFDNPFFSVTAADGSYKVANVPAGNYTLVAKHELYGEVRKEIEIHSSETATIEFEFAPPKK